MPPIFPFTRRADARRRFAVALLAAVAAGFGWRTPAGAQTWQDSGTFSVTIAGRPAGTERFAIRRGGGPAGDVIATGTVELVGAAGMLRLTPRLRASGPGAAAVAYEVEGDGDELGRLTGRASGGRFGTTSIGPGGERYREYVASSGAVILDEWVAHHHWFVIGRAPAGGAVPIIVPRENRQMVATVARLESAPLRIGGREVAAQRWSIEPQGATARVIWADAAGRLLRVEIPEREYVAVRVELPQ